MAETKAVVEHLARREAVEAASTTLEQHREEYERFCRDESAFLDRSRALFTEERFAPLWFTPGEVQQALEKEGYVAHGLPDDQTVQTLRAALLRLAEGPRRVQLSLGLLAHLPWYVDEHRYLDAWMIQQMAVLTQEDASESNPFLYEMFRCGYDAWLQNQHELTQKALREAGLSPEKAAEMSPEELDAWLKRQMADPAQKARMEFILRDDPELQALAASSMRNIEVEFGRLLEREDADHLLLTADEVSPWLSVLGERMQKAGDKAPQSAGPEPLNPKAQKAFAKLVWSVTSDMAKSIFTPERLRQCVDQFQEYRQECFAAGDKKAANCILAVVASLRNETQPGDNNLLNILCHASLHLLIEELAEPSSPPQPPPIS